MDERPLTPKPDPIVLNKPVPVVPQVNATQPINNEPLNSNVSVANKTQMQKLKEWYSKNKRLAIALSVLGVILLIIIILIIFSYKPAGTIKNNPVSAPTNVTEEPGELIKKCDALNQNISLNVPSDWECGTTSESSQDLQAQNDEISINFPLDVQPALGCGINATNCTAEVLYSSAKVDQLKAYKLSGKIDVMSANIVLDSKKYIVNLRLLKPQNELTTSQRALIIKILENVSINTEFSGTRTLSFNLDPVQVGAVPGSKSLSGSIVADRDITLQQKDKTSVSISKGTTALVISSLYEWTGVQFVKSDLVGTTPYLGTTYRVVQGVEASELTYYVPAAQLTLTGHCGVVSAPTGYFQAPCGTIPTDGGYFFRCTGENNKYDVTVCDSIMKNLTIAIKNN